jgi:hypothetical protein
MQANRGDGDGEENTQKFQEQHAADITERVLERRHHSAQVELDLRKLENDLLNAHVRMIQLFMPANFTVRGGDADGVNIELLLRRMSNKARIIQTHTVRAIFSVFF